MENLANILSIPRYTRSEYGQASQYRARMTHPDGPYHFFGSLLVSLDGFWERMGALLGSLFLNYFGKFQVAETKVSAT